MHPNLSASLDVKLLGVHSFEIGDPPDAELPQVSCDALADSGYFLECLQGLLSWPSIQWSFFSISTVIAPFG